MSLLLIFILIFILFIRLKLLKNCSLQAVDQFYWLNYRNSVNQQKMFPPKIPIYILDVKQWYPPLFGYFLSKLPDRIFKHSIILTQILSLIRLTIIIIFFFYIKKSFSFEIFLGIIIYLTSPILVYYDNQINSRILGAIILDILILLFYFYFQFLYISLLIPIIILTIFLIYTHKMCHQLYLFILIGLSIYYKTIIPIGIYSIAIIISFLFFNYKKYLLAHIDIVTFWHRNKYKLGAHQFYESPIYGKKNFVYKNRIHGKNLKLWLKKIALIIGMFPFMIFLIFNLKFNYFGLIIFFTLLFIFLTSFVPFLYCLGMGALYTYNLVSFSILYIVYTRIDYHTCENIFLLFLTFLLTSINILKFYNGLKQKSKQKDILLEQAIDFLKKYKDIDRILVIPFQLPDEIAYKTAKKVFWGAHGLGFKWLEPYFPVFKVKVEDAIQDWNLGGVFLQKNYWPEFFEKVNQKLFDKIYENDKYVILKVKNWKNEDKIPDWAKENYKCVE